MHDAMCYFFAVLWTLCVYCCSDLDYRLSEGHHVCSKQTCGEGRTFIWRQRLLFCSHQPCYLLAAARRRLAVWLPLIHPNPSICWCRRFSIICKQWESGRAMREADKVLYPDLTAHVLAVFVIQKSNWLAQIFGCFGPCCEELLLCTVAPLKSSGKCMYHLICHLPAGTFRGVHMIMRTNGFLFL
jgi:hypothetical protein